LTSPAWRVEFHPAAARDLRKLGVEGELRVLRFLRQRIAGGKDPGASAMR
jgi:mRNA interferase RelE/StbE